MCGKGKVYDHMPAANAMLSRILYSVFKSVRNSVLRQNSAKPAINSHNLLLIGIDGATTLAEEQ